MRDDLTRLIKKPPTENRLPAPDTPPPIRDKTGLERRQAGDVSSTEVVVKSTDGLFQFTVRVVKA